MTFAKKSQNNKNPMHKLHLAAFIQNLFSY